MNDIIYVGFPPFFPSPCSLSICSEAFACVSVARLFSFDDALGFQSPVFCFSLYIAVTLPSRLHITYVSCTKQTYSGSALISVNPFQRLELYGNEMMAMYKECHSDPLATELPAPHLYSIADRAYRGVVEGLKSQSIVVGGESGAGKTEATKLILSYLARVKEPACSPLAVQTTRVPRRSITSPSRLGMLEVKLMESNPLLEAFGNAKTVRNENSSRFGKYIKVYFNNQGQISSAFLEHYLLEKSRIVSQGLGERNFHVFYQLCSGASELLREALYLGPRSEMHNFRYLVQGGCTEQNGVDDAEEFADTQRAMSMLGLEEECRDAVYHLLASILHLGNVGFMSSEKKEVVYSSGPSDRNGDNNPSKAKKGKKRDPMAARSKSRGRSQTVSGKAPGKSATSTDDKASLTKEHSRLVKRIATLLSIDGTTLESSLLTRSVRVMSERIEVSLSPSQSIAARDAICKAIYDHLFKWLILCVNACLHGSILGRPSSPRAGPTPNQKDRFIGLLDIFGFERFPENSFEQLCINYANESIQQFYIRRMFKDEQAVYEEEGIQWTKIDYADNRECLSLLQDRPVGVFQVLNEECVFPNGNDASFVAKLAQLHKDNPYLSTSMPSPAFNGSFTVQHYAGAVEYGATGFLAKNRDHISEDIQSLLLSSKSQVIRQIMMAQLPDSLVGEEDDEKSNDLPGDVDATRFKLTLPPSVKDKIGAGSIPSRNRAATFTAPKKSGSDRISSLAVGRTRSRASTVAADKFIAAQFRGQLINLVDTIGTTETQFVRCIKPSEKVPHEFNREPTLQQLQNAGVMQCVKIRKAGYAHRRHYSEVLQEFGVLTQGLGLSASGSVEERAKALVIAAGERANLPASDWCFGKTRVFCRNRVWKALTTARKSIRVEAALSIQAALRSFQERKKLQFYREERKRKEAEKLEATLCIQALVRSWLATKRMLRRKTEREAAAKAKEEESKRKAQEAEQERLKKEEARKLQENREKADREKSKQELEIQLASQLRFEISGVASDDESTSQPGAFRSIGSPSLGSPRSPISPSAARAGSPRDKMLKAFKSQVVQHLSDSHSPRRRRTRGVCLSEIEFEMHVPPGNHTYVPDTAEENSRGSTAWVRYPGAKNASKSTYGSRGMLWLARSLKSLRDSSGKHGVTASAVTDEKGLFEFSPESMMWMTKRIYHTRQVNQYTPWETEDGANLHRENVSRSRVHQSLLDKKSSRTAIPAASSPAPRSPREMHDPPSDVQNLEDSTFTLGSSLTANDLSFLRQRSMTQWRPETVVPFVPPVLKSHFPPVPLRYVLENAELRMALRSYMEENYCQENLDFYEAVEAFVAQGQLEGTPLAVDIFEQYIKQGSEDQVNIDAATREDVRSRLEKMVEVEKELQSETLSDPMAAEEDLHLALAPFLDLFENAQQVIVSMVETDVYKRFAESQDYINMMSSYFEEQIVKGNTNILKGDGWVNDAGYQSLHVDVLSAQNISNKDSISAFCEVTMDGRKFTTGKTKDVEEPQWNEHFEFPLRETTQHLEINVWNKSHFLGVAFIPIQYVPSDKDPLWYVLLARSKNQVVSGAVQLRLWLSQDPPDADIMSKSKTEEKGSSLTDIIRKKTSKQKKRFREDGFDLDLTYITDRVIAMGFPSESIERIYRNRMKDVQRFFQKRHPGSYKVYNLCSERDYDPQKFGGRVAYYPFDDHNPSSFELIPRLCADVQTWLAEHPQNVAAIHCKAGKGRTGMMVSALLMHLDRASHPNAETALDAFAKKRTEDGAGVTIPSQRRYVGYADQYFKLVEKYYLNHPRLSGGPVFPPSSHILPNKMFLMSSVSLWPLFKSMRSHNTEVWFEVSSSFTFFSSRDQIAVRRARDELLFVCGNKIPVAGDIKVVFYHSTLFGRERMFQFWFNTRFIEGSRLTLTKMQLDKAHKDTKHKTFPEDLCVEIKLEPVNMAIRRESRKMSQSLRRVRRVNRFGSHGVSVDPSQHLDHRSTKQSREFKPHEMKNLLQEGLVSVAREFHAKKMNKERVSQGFKPSPPSHQAPGNLKLVGELSSQFKARHSPTASLRSIEVSEAKTNTGERKKPVIITSASVSDRRAFFNNLASPTAPDSAGSSPTGFKHNTVGRPSVPRKHTNINVNTFTPPEQKK